jgi:N-acylneuraminate cytidylyltransferase
MITHVVIPARKGSKGIKNKNIVKIREKELIKYTINVAKKCSFVNKIIVSTDGKKIAALSIKSGVEVPFLRPPKYSRDSSTDLEVFSHYIDWLEKKHYEVPDVLIHLRPTTPFRDFKIIKKAFIKFLQVRKKGYSCLRSMRMSVFSPYKMWKIKNNKAKPFLDDNYKHSYPRQYLVKSYDHIGYVDILDVKKTIKKKSISGSKIFPFIICENNLRRFIDIDNETDLNKARKIANAK